MKRTNITTLKNILYAFMTAVLIINVSACSGEDGTDGIDGIDGVDGQDGQNGNANVIVSDWFQVQYDNTSSTTPPTWGTMLLQNDDIPEIDLEGFVETGGIALVYSKSFEGSGENHYIISLLPHTMGNVSFTSAFYYSQSVLSLAIRIEGPDVSSLENIPNLTFRYVLVPPNLITARQANGEKQWSDININNYDEVASFLELNP